MAETRSDAGFRGPAEQLRVVIAYNEIAAGKRAMRVMTELGREAGEQLDFHPFPWSFNLLADTNWGAIASSDAVQADILIIATNSPHPLPAAVGQWAEAAIDCKQGTATAVIALFGTEENPDGAGSVRLEAIQQAARQAGLAFFAPSSPDPLYSPRARAASDQSLGAGVVATARQGLPSALATNRGHAPKAGSFRFRFCAAHQCGVAEFGDRVLLRALPVHAVPVALLLWPWRRRWFAADHALIEKLGGAQWRGETQWKIERLRTSGSRIRQWLGCCISNRRLASLMNRVMHSDDLPTTGPAPEISCKAQSQAQPGGSLSQLAHLTRMPSNGRESA